MSILRTLLAGTFVIGTSGCVFLEPCKNGNCKVTQSKSSPVQKQQAKSGERAKDAFLRELDSHLSNNEVRRAWATVRRSPELALHSLRSAKAEQSNGSAIRFAARQYDEMFCNGPTWQTLVDDRNKNPKKFAAYEASREQASAWLDKPNDACPVAPSSLVKSCPSDLLSLDALELAGRIHLQQSQADKAAALFQQGVDRAEKSDRLQYAILLLHLSDARRRQGQIDKADQAWDQAALLAGGWLEGKQRIALPDLWERISFLRPMNRPFPAEVVAKLTHACQSVLDLPPAADEDAHVVLWSWIGHGRLLRHNGQAALQAFKRAESFAKAPARIDHFHLLEARALTAMQQPGAALPLLAKLTNKKGSVTSRQALVMLASMKLESNQTDQAEVFLRAALEEDASNWPGSAEALANLAIVQLMNEQKEAGLATLHQAQERFESAGDWEGLLQCLHNEAACHDQAERPQEASRVRQRMTLLMTQ